MMGKYIYHVSPATGQVCTSSHYQDVWSSGKKIKECRRCIYELVKQKNRIKTKGKWFCEASEFIDIKYIG